MPTDNKWASEHLSFHMGEFGSSKFYQCHLAFRMGSRWLDLGHAPSCAVENPSLSQTCLANEKVIVGMNRPIRMHECEDHPNFPRANGFWLSCVIAKTSKMMWRSMYVFQHLINDRCVYNVTMATRHAKMRCICVSLCQCRFQHEWAITSSINCWMKVITHS